MKCYITKLYTHCLELLQQFPGKMQAGCGCGRRSGYPGIDGLIPFPVLQLLLDVRRQGHFPKALQRFQKNTLVVEPDQAGAAFHFAHHLCGERVVAKAYLRAGVQLLARTNQALPHFLAPVDQQQHLAGPPCLPAAQQTGGKHPAVVEH